MRRIVILGPGASGKSTLASRIGEITGLPVIELDKLFWRPSLSATPRDEWIAIQEQLTRADRWIMDGDLGLYDAVHVRLRASDTVVFLDFSSVRCAWRAVRRSRERGDFWMWLLRYRRHFRPLLLDEITRHASHATMHVLRDPAAVKQFIAQLEREYERREAP